MSTQEYIRSLTELNNDEFPTLTPLPEASETSSGFFSNVSWQTWIIIFLILTLLGINVFAYLAKGTEETVSVFNKYFAPILGFFGYSTLETTKQTVQTSATGTKAGVDVVTSTTTGAIDVLQKSVIPSPTSGTSVGVPTNNIPKGYASLDKGGPQVNNIPKNGVQQIRMQQNKMQQNMNNVEERQQNALENALEDASQKYKEGPIPNDSIISGKAGWCFIGAEQGLRTCSEIGVNDLCMSGDIFPTQEVCMNPNLRV